MPEFRGFPSKSGRQTPIPNLFFTAVLPMIDNLAEAKVTLHLFWKLHWKKGYPRFVTLKELAGDLDLMSGLALGGEDPSKGLKQGLERALDRGTFVHLGLESETSTEHLYFPNTDTDRRAIARVQAGEVELGAMPQVGAMPEPPEHRNIYGLYEENIGLLTPLVAEELREAEDQYPFPWIVDAFREAVARNRRRWRYVQRVLEAWKAEGKPDGQHRRDHQGPRPEAPAARRRSGYLVRRKPRG